MASKAPAKATTQAPAKTTAAPAKKAETAKPVPETLIKKRRTAEIIRKHNEAKKVALKKKHRVTRRAIFKRAEQYVSEYRSQERSLIRSRRQAKESGNFFLEPEAKLAFVFVLEVSMVWLLSQERSCNS
jgi:hypothetical protein